MWALCQSLPPAALGERQQRGLGGRPSTIILRAEGLMTG